MIYIKRLLLILIVAVLIVFTIQNQVNLGQKVDLVFFKYQASLVLGIWLALGFIVGALLFLIIDLPRTYSLKRNVRRKSEEIARLQFEVNRLQAAAPAASQPFPPNPDLEKRLGL